MKIAYLMNGVIGGLSGKNCLPNDIDIRSEIVKYTASTHKYLKRDDIDIDYFIFSWEPYLYDAYVDAYNPKAIITIEQYKFDVPPHYAPHVDNPRIQAHYSRWFGAKHVHDLMLEYKKNNNVHYDLVINARLDLCYHEPIDLSSFNTNQVNIGYYVNLKYNWPVNDEIADHFFASSENNMFNISRLFDHLNEYTKPDQCPRWNLISNHFLIVWHLRKLGLLNKDTIHEALSSFNNGYCKDVQYHIFRYQNLTKEQLLAYNKE